MLILFTKSLLACDMVKGIAKVGVYDSVLALLLKAFSDLVLKLLISSMVEGKITKVSADIVAISS